MVQVMAMVVWLWMVLIQMDTDEEKPRHFYDAISEKLQKRKK
jgi:hypothetical protein